MERLSRGDLVALAESVAREVGIIGELRIEEEVHDQAPFGKFASSDVHLESTAHDSCPITIALFEEGEAEGYGTIGFGSSYHEAWFLNPDETIAVVREFLAAIMCGNYEEW